MNYHNITKDDMLNGVGLRVVLWVAGCEQHCKNCQNPETWDKDSGILFDDSAKQELYEALNKDYIDGITFSGGHPLESYNYNEVYELCKEIRKKFPTKTIWLYTGFNYEDMEVLSIMKYIDVLVDGRFIEELKDNKLHWRGSSNQRVIDVQKSRESGEVVLFDKL